ncbi:MAG: hypothetical protein QY325_09515 [Flavobacteriales bacterium]|nr:MAG: hypothetical protein QY325_09515 [Flavobacteriales bacterium]
MRAKSFLQHLILGALLLTTGKVVGQSTTPGNVAGAGTDFLGWNNNGANNFPLRVPHNLNQPIDFYTSAIHRMRLNPSWTTTIGAFPPQDASGYLGLCPTGTIWNGNPGPFSRLHLSDGTTPQQGSHRPWMRNGVTLTGNRDHGYLGQKANGADNTDMVLHWSDNPGVNFSLGRVSRRGLCTSVPQPS